jgi:hypothetical protein
MVTCAIAESETLRDLDVTPRKYLDAVKEVKDASPDAIRGLLLEFPDVADRACSLWVIRFSD